MMKILIADDHSLVRYGLKLALHNHFKDSQIDESWDGASVKAQFAMHAYDLLLLDLNMPETDSTVLLQWILEFHANTKVLVVSMNDESIFGKRSLQQGAHGYLEKDSSPEELLKAVRTILDGKRYASPNLATILINDTLTGKSGNPFDQLTTREFQVAIYLAKDYSVTQISEILQVQYTSVNTFKRRIFKKLNIENRSALVRLADAYNLG
ncbi:two-component system invasion response regulator UvrY [Dyadobacter sp. BE34]|uniref:Two-component system invasion response regulator UvrY n=1 Tax=Dyadobacter fermentans TaxID=94254 RepID=A0ABU1QWH6_9BACT|nr:MULTISPECIES: response regulator transcription factor [Dyadobacter]MDR6805514.1 two-component system invasion response regulator UvrY [Dyadobacter fermentans]MDR7042726.1 two-component system invasion response regulator UvrY [Dyadobacter sp. BE242]MDR7197038.1 two-component system invasion response regulator UvrY [Dyadobacter sp. BE34]MDR7215527.1 two-component system invasion response regulator UvrY [Dyadobacter sp. BE31]MDR7263063.1 two-component system invasion response regulator UvrY [D